MSRYWNTRTQNIVPYVPGEQPRDRKFIKLNTNENPYPPSPKVIEAVKNAANGDLRLYPDPDSTAFREAAAAHYGVKPGQVFAGNGSDEILAFAFAAFFENVDSRGVQPLLFPDVTYSFYPVYAGLWNIPYRAIPLREDFSINCTDYRIPCGGVIFPNPNAPTGIPVPIEDILSLAEYLETQNKVLIADEAYIAFGASCNEVSRASCNEVSRASCNEVSRASCNEVSRAQSAVPYINKHPNLLTIHTMSKSASLAGLRFGFAIGNEELIEGLRRIKDSFNSYPIDRLALAGAVAAVNDWDYYNVINKKVTETRDRISKELRLLGFIVLPSAANFIFVKAPGIDGVNFFCALREKGILARHFNKERTADYLRVSIGTDDEMNLFLAACRELIK